MWLKAVASVLHSASSAVLGQGVGRWQPTPANARPCALASRTRLPVPSPVTVMRVSTCSAQRRFAAVAPALLCAHQRQGKRTTPDLFGARGYYATKSRTRVSAASGPGPVAIEEQEYWREVLEGINKPGLRAMKQLMDVSHPVGFTMEQSKKLGATVNCFDVYVEQKRKHPRCMVLVQVGSFYEAIGIDALIMIAYLGFRPSAAQSGIPKAGVPVDQKARIVADLNTLGFGVAIVSEAPGDGRSGRSKTRFLDVLSTPARPKYIKLAGTSTADQNSALFAHQKPILGIAHSKSGFITYSLEPGLTLISKTEGMTWDGVLAQLWARGASCLLLHDSVSEQARSHSLTLTRFGKKDVGQFFKYSHDDPTRGFIHEVCKVLQESGDAATAGVTSFTVVTRLYNGDGQPQALPRSTVVLLGMEGHTANQSLLKTALPQGSLMATNWMRDLLLMPPPPSMARHLQATVLHLLTTNEPLSGYKDLPAGKVAEVINSLDGDGPFFLELHGMLAAVLEMLRNSGHGKMWEHVIPYAMWKTLRQAEELDASQLTATLGRVSSRVVEVVNLPAQQSHADGMEYLDDTWGSDLGEGARVKPVKASLQQGPEAVMRFRQANEKFKLIINRDQMTEAFDKVDTAFQQLYDGTQRLYSPIHREVNSGRPPAAKDQIHIVNVEDGEYLAVRIPKGATISTATIAKHSPGGIVTCLLEREVKGAGDVWMTGEMEEALSRYHEACADANKMADQNIKDLCIELQPHLSDLILACQCSVTIKALSIHTQMAHKANWVVPTLVTPLAPASGTEPSSTTLPHMCMELKGYWPYWMADMHPTVLNDLTLDRMQLLTGPNMAGKSTVLRSVCAIAILANCGLMVPARQASVPFYDAYYLRNFSGDAPVENKSSFALEMQEVNIMDRQCTSKSLVLLDEMSKGTEVMKGSALAAAVLMDWCNRGFTGMFATHLHALVPITEKEGLEQQGLLAYKCMGLEEKTEVKEGVARLRRRGTWKLQDGRCFESLAFEVAQDQGLDPALVNSAEDIYWGILRGQFPLAGRTDGKRPEHMTVGNSDANNSQSSSTSHQAKPSSSGSAQAVMHTSDTNTVPAVAASATPSGTSAASVSPSPDRAVTQVLRKTLGDAREVLRATVDEWMALHAPDQAGQVLYRVVEARRTPPASHSNQPAVYVIQWPNGQFHVGQTLDVFKAIMEHRRRGPPTRFRYRGSRTCMVYAVLPQSVPRAKDELESKVIEACQAGGFPLTSKSPGLA